MFYWLVILIFMNKKNIVRLNNGIRININELDYFNFEEFLRCKRKFLYVVC